MKRCYFTGMREIFDVELIDRLFDECEKIINAEDQVEFWFFHGENDDFVPCDMSRAMYDACVSRKKLVTVPGAGHGLSYPVAPEEYLESLRAFFDLEASAQ